jgi:two-component system response regulator DevR
MPVTVLLADDHEVIRKAIRSLLTRDPEIEIVGEAISLTDTIRLTAELTPQVVVMDLHMGDENLVDPLEVQSRLAGTRVVAVSVWNDEETRILAERYGAAVLLDKVSLAKELIPAIRAVANGRK